MAMESLFMILVVLAVLLTVGVPISYSIGISALIAILRTVPLEVSVVTGAQRIFVGMSKFSLTAIPFFILAGNLMNQGGIAKRLVDFVMAILGKLPGALLVTNAGANALFGAISGSASAAAAAVGSMVEKGEEEQGYDKALCAAANGASAPSGLLIPPSNALITYSLAAGGTSVAALFMAGYIPGIIWAVACMAVAVIIAKKKGYKGIPGKYDWKNLWHLHPQGPSLPFSDHSCNRRHHRRRVYRYGRLCHRGDLRPDPGRPLPQHYLKILLENRSRQRQNERYGRIPDRRFQYPWLGHGIYPDPSGHLRRALRPYKQSHYHPSDHECHPFNRRNLYGRNAGYPDLHSPVPPGG